MRCKRCILLSLHSRPPSVTHKSLLVFLFFSCDFFSTLTFCQLLWFVVGLDKSIWAFILKYFSLLMCCWNFLPEPKKMFDHNNYFTEIKPFQILPPLIMYIAVENSLFMIRPVTNQWILKTFDFTWIKNESRYQSVLLLRTPHFPCIQTNTWYL